MKTFLKLASGAAIGALMVGQAGAADVYKGGLKDGDVGPMEFAEGGIVNWSGFYIGGAVGYGKAQHDVEVRQYGGGRAEIPGTPEIPAVPASCSIGEVNKDGDGCKNKDAVFTKGKAGIAAIPAIPAVDAIQFGAVGLDGIGGDGFIGGGRLGYDFAIGRFLVGVFGEYNFSNVESNLDMSFFGTGASYSLEKDNEWTVGVRAGAVIAPRTLAYALIGYTESDFSLNGPGIAATATFDPERTLSGVTFGGGVEYALSGNIFLGLEGQYTLYDKETWFDGRDAVGNGTVIDAETDELKVLGTMKIKLNRDVFGR